MNPRKHKPEILNFTPKALAHFKHKVSLQGKENKVKLIQVEENFGSGMFIELLKPYLMKEYPCTIQGVRHTTQKEKRIIDCLEPLMNQHRLVISDKVVQEDYTSTQIHTPEMALRYQLFYQMSRITRDKGSLAHDDRLDVLAMSCQYWADRIAKDADSNLISI